MKQPALPRLLSLLSLLLALTLLLASCGGETPSSTDVTTSVSVAQTTTADHTPARQLTLFSGGKSDYVLVRPMDANKLTVYSDLLLRLRETSGVKFAIETDEIYRGHEYNAEKPEILCGYVNYPEAKQAVEGLALNEYRISVVGNKLVLAARTDEGLEAACTAFCDYVEANMQDGTLTISDSLLLTGESKNSAFGLLTDKLPAVNGYGTATLSLCGDGYQQATLSDTSAESFAAYRKTLEAEGFALYSERNMGDTLFATYQKDGLSVHAYFTPHNAETRLVVSKDATVPSTTPVTYTKVCEPTVTLMGLEKSGAEGGLGCILGLEDGTFIVIDGGNNTQEEADDLANTLRKLAPDPKNVTIRAWYITHSHGDHFGAFAKFSQLYARSGNFHVESFVYNFCDVAAQKPHGSISYKTPLQTMNAYWKDAVRYKALTGQVYRYAGCDIEILYCMSDFIPQIIGEEKGIRDIDQSKLDNNIESVVFRAAMGEQTVLITGDTSKVCVDEMCDRYGTYLKSDIITVPHHGHNRNSYRARNGTVEFYNLTDPAIVLWPAGVSAQASYLNWNGKPDSNYEANHHLVNNLHVKEVIVAGSTTRTLTLPYTK